MKRAHLQPLQTVLEPLHALVAEGGANAAGLEQHSLPSAAVRDLAVRVGRWGGNDTRPCILNRRSIVARCRRCGGS